MERKNFWFEHDPRNTAISTLRRQLLSCLSITSDMNVYSRKDDSMKCSANRTRLYFSTCGIQLSTKAKRRPKDSWLERLQAWIVIHVFLWERAHRKGRATLGVF